MSHVSGDETATTGVQELRGDIAVLFIGFMAGGCLEQEWGMKWKKYNEDQVNVNGLEFSYLVPDRAFPKYHCVPEECRLLKSRRGLWTNEGDRIVFFLCDQGEVVNKEINVLWVQFWSAAALCKTWCTIMMFMKIFVYFYDLVLLVLPKRIWGQLLKIPVQMTLWMRVHHQMLVVLGWFVKSII